jgi:hypothetical protein
MPARAREEAEEEAADHVDDGGEPAAKRARVVGEICAIATPLASEKLHKKLFKAVKRAAASKSLKRGVKEVVKALRKGEKGLVVLAGDMGGRKAATLKISEGEGLTTPLKEARGRRTLRTAALSATSTTTRWGEAGGQAASSTCGGSAS